MTSLRDKANLALGYAFLQDDQPLAAKPALQRVRLEGPFSNKALLGVGWADAELENYSRALVPWMALRGRNLLDSAVQESIYSFINQRGKFLAKTVRNIIDELDLILSDDFFEHSVIKGFLVNKRSKFPSYLSPDTFSKILFDILPKCSHNLQ